MTRVKICGLTNSADVSAAIECGADALGFIFVPESPRYIAKRAGISAILQAVPPFIARVGVCLTVDQIPESMLPLLDVIQVYSHSESSGKRIVRAFQIRSMESVDEIATALVNGRPEAIMLDTFHGERLGGSGETFDWSLATIAKARFGLPTILAGGLTPANVGDAVRQVRPFAVDVSSGVEKSPGVKDHATLTEFVDAVRLADRRGASVDENRSTR